MALRIANNIAAMTTQRWLGIADAGMKRSLERLSSGYRINRAADDAAGLAISQSFRAEIASFRVAYRNTSEAASLLQVAEGGMDQIGNMLTRLKELSTQAASENVGLNITKVAAEADELVEEINRIANSTKYGGATLLVGESSSQTIYTTGSFTSGGTMTAGSAISTLQSTGNEWYGLSVTTSAPGTISSAAGGLAEFVDTLTDAENIWTLNANGTGTGFTVTNGDFSFNANATADTSVVIYGMGDAGGNLTLTTVNATTGTMDGDTFTLNSSGLDDDTVTIDETAVNATYTFTVDSGGTVTINDGTTDDTATGATAGATLDFSAFGIEVILGSEYDAGDLVGLEIVVGGAATSTTAAVTDKGYEFQIGSENNVNNQLTVTVSSVLATDLQAGLTAGLLATSDKAKVALTNVDTAISTLSTTRGNLGAAQNRVSYAGANLLTVIENVQAAESVIRDVDMASEMTLFTKNQILLQAGTAMLAQANMAPQQVLALFG